MDVDELRRKRVKLFDSQSARHGHGEANSSSTAANLNMTANDTYPATFPQRLPHPRHQAGYPPNMDPPPSAPSISDDERYARELQAEIERQEKPQYRAGNKPFVLPSHLANPPTEDEKREQERQKQFTDQLYKSFGSKYYLPPNNFDFQPDAPWTEDMAAEDEKLARELQAQMDRDDYDYPLLPLPASSPNPHVQLPPTSNASTRSMAHDIDESIDAFVVCEFAGTVIAVDCGICGCRITIDQEKLVTLFKSVVAEPGCEQVKFLIKCSACAGKTCPGCATAVTASGMSYGSTARNAVHEIWHCDRGRLALIWFLLCGYDHVVIHNKPQTASNQKPKTPAPDDELTGRSRSKGKQKGFSGIGYSSNGGDDYDDDDHYSEMEQYFLSDPHYVHFKGWKGNTGANMQGSQKKRHKRKVSVPKPAPVDPDDSITTHIMCLVSAALPSITDRLPATEFDFGPPQFLASMLRRSSILDKAAELLRNDSLDDASQRYWLYDSVIAFTSALNSGGQLMTSILHELRQINKAGHDLLKVSFSQPTRVTGESVDTAQSLATCMDNLARQSERMMKVMQGSADDIENEEEQRTLLLCTMISDCAASISKESAKLRSAAPVAGTQQKNDGEWQKDLVILPVADDTIMKHHHHAPQAKALLEVTSPPRRRLAHIFKEIVTLETSLPPGIFVRYGETRPDVMKIVIIGPQGTPYENGMFEFDLFCPLEYPNVPPMMILRTTGGNTVGFNPNLYADGKVCLSLLGTWQGETWEPGKSTLLQVLVSIQAMIFNDEPWCNEPGRESHRGSEQSKSHNRYLYDKVVKFGMIEWLENKRSRAPASKKGTDRYGHVLGTSTSDNKVKEEDIWADVAKKHFEAAEDEIIKTVCNWVNDKPPPPRAGARTGNGKQVPFSGAGRTIADAENKSGPSTSPPFHPSKLKQSGNLASKLKEVVKELQSNSRSCADFYGYQEEGPWGDEGI
jgi:baculoviral IAP repeat-containing protein 6